MDYGIIAGAAPVTFKAQLICLDEVLKDQTRLGKRHVKQSRHVGALERPLHPRELHHQLPMTNLIDALLVNIAEGVTRFFVDARRKKVRGRLPGAMRLDQAALDEIAQNPMQTPLINMGFISESTERHLTFVSNDGKNHEGEHGERLPRLTLFLVKAASKGARGVKSTTSFDVEAE